MISRKNSLKWHDRPRPEIGRLIGRGPGGLWGSSLLLIMGAFSWQNALANWEFNPSLGVGATFTDNINLEIESAAEDELAFEINPAFTLSNDSKDWQVSLDYLMENLLFTRDNRGNETFHSFDGTSVSRLVGDDLSLTVNSRFYQQIIDAEKSVRFSNISTSSNFSDAWVNSVSPQWSHNFGARFVAQASYRYSSTDYLDRADDGRTLNDVQTQAVTAGFGSQQRPGRLEWDVSYLYQRAEPDQAREFEYERAVASVGIPVSPNLVLTGEAGAESDVIKDPSVAGLDQSFGEVGMRWFRGERTSVELGIGHRVFGTSYRGAVSHAGKRLTLSAGYSEDVSTFALQQINAASVGFYQSSNLGDPLQGIDDRVFVRKSFNTGASWAMPRGTIRVSAFANRREYVDSGGDVAKIRGISSSADRNLGPRTRASVDVVWYRTEPGGNEPDGFEHSRITAEATRSIGRSLSATVSVRRATRSADFMGREFQEHAASVFLNWAP